MRKPRRAHPSPVNPGSMADIGTLMIILVLCITSPASNDWGLSMKLPPWFEYSMGSSPDELPIFLRIDINSKQELMVNSKIVSISEVRLMSKVFIADHVTRGIQPVVQFRTNRHSSYSTYIAVLNEIKGAYNELWETESSKLFNDEYYNLSKDQKRKIRRKYPFAVMEMEADHYLNTF